MNLNCLFIISSSISIYIEAHYIDTTDSHKNNRNLNCMFKFILFLPKDKFIS